MGKQCFHSKIGSINWTKCRREKSCGDWPVSRWIYHSSTDLNRRNASLDMQCDRRDGYVTSTSLNSLIYKKRSRIATFSTFCDFSSLRNLFRSSGGSLLTCFRTLRFFLIAVYLFPSLLHLLTKYLLAEEREIQTWRQLTTENSYMNDDICIMCNRIRHWTHFIHKTR